MNGVWFGSNWAQPVTSRSWAFAAKLLDVAKRLSGYRVCVGATHWAWLRATEAVGVGGQR